MTGGKVSSAEHHVDVDGQVCYQTTMERATEGPCHHWRPDGGEFGVCGVGGEPDRDELRLVFKEYFPWRNTHRCE